MAGSGSLERSPMDRLPGSVGRMVAICVCYLRSRRCTGWPSRTAPHRNHIAMAGRAKCYPRPWVRRRTRPLHYIRLLVRVRDTAASHPAKYH